MRVYVLQDFRFEDRSSVHLFETRSSLQSHMFKEDMEGLKEMHSGRDAWAAFLDWDEQERIEFWNDEYQTQYCIEIEETIP